MRKKILSWVLTAAMLLSVLGAVPFAAAADPAYVCQMGETGYETFGEALAAAGDGDTITLLDDISYYGDILLTNTDLHIDLGTYDLSIGTDDSDGALTVDGGALTIDDSYGGKLKIQRGKTGLKALNGGSAVVSLISDMGNDGIVAESGSTVTVKGSVMSADSFGLEVKGGSSVYVMGDVECGLAVMVRGSGSSAMIDGSVRGGVPFKPGSVYVDDGATITVGGNVQGVGTAVYCGGGSSAHIKGNATASRWAGVEAYEGSNITIDGSVTSAHALRADGAGSEVLVKKNATTTDDESYGAYASNGGKIRVGGIFTAAKYVRVGDTDLSKDDGVLSGHDAVYTDGTSTVNLKGIEFFKEDFEDTSVGAWDADGSGWVLVDTLSEVTSYARSGSKSIRFDTGYEQDTISQTKGVNLTYGSAYWLEFFMRTDSEEVSAWDCLTVQISTDEGASWEDVGSFKCTSAQDGWVKKSIDLNDYLGQPDVRIALVGAFSGAAGAGIRVFIDDITVSHECLMGCGTSEASGGYIETSEIGGETYYHVSTPEQLAHIDAHSNLNFLQIADIDLANYNGGIWPPIDGLLFFTGKYDGQGHSINGLRFYYDEEIEEKNYTSSMGLFPKLDGSVSNLKIALEGVEIRGDHFDNFGTIAGRMDGGTIRNCEVVISGDIDFRSYGNIGGIVGSSYAQIDLESGTYAGLIEGCSVTFNGGSIKSQGKNHATGGIAGVTNCTIKGCTVTIGEGECISGFDQVGGIVGGTGYMNDYGHYLEGCKVTGDGKLELSGNSDSGFTIGGIVGSCVRTVIRDCKSDVTIAASPTSLEYNTYGAYDEYCAYAGGIAGMVGEDTTIIGCDNVGVVALMVPNNFVNETGAPSIPSGYEYAYAGGIIGYISESVNITTTIENCQNSASVTAINLIPSLKANSGGIVGYIESGIEETAGVTIKNCANVGSDKTISAIASNTFAGGIAGSGGYIMPSAPNIVIENCYNRSSVRSVSNGGPGEGESAIGLTAGGIIGAADKIMVRACYSTAPSVSAVNYHWGGAYSGGVVGLIGSATFTQNYCETNDNVTKAAGGHSTVEGIVPQSDISGSYQCATAQNLNTKSFYGTAWKWYTGGGTAPDYYSASTPWRMTSSTSYPALRGTAYDVCIGHVTCVITPELKTVDIVLKINDLTSIHADSVKVFYAIYNNNRMIGLASKNVVLSSNSMENSATVVYQGTVAPDACKVFITSVSGAPVCGPLICRLE